MRLTLLCFFLSFSVLGQEKIFFTREFQLVSEKKTDQVRTYFKEEDHIRIEDHVRDTITHRATITGLTKEGQIDDFAFYCITQGTPLYYNMYFDGARAVFDFYEKGKLAEQIVVRSKNVRYAQVWSSAGEPLLTNGTGTTRRMQNQHDYLHEAFRDSVLQSSFIARGLTHDTIYNKVDMAAIPNGGLSAFANELVKYIKFPTAAVLARKEGYVYIEFVVDERGNLTEFKPLSAEGYNFEKKTLRNFKKLPPWNPAIHKGHRVKTKFVQPIRFKFTG
jgi:TonB family protein